MQILNQKQMSSDVPADPAFGLKRPAFGLSREPINRVELVLAMKGGGVINVFEEIEADVTPARLKEYAGEIANGIEAGKARMFSDSPNATGQHSWINLGEIAAFTVRQAK